jgi:hypothetical protein
MWMMMWNGEVESVEKVKKECEMFELEMVMGCRWTESFV